MKQRGKKEKEKRIKGDNVRDHGDNVKHPNI